MLKLTFNLKHHCDSVTIDMNKTSLVTKHFLCTILLQINVVILPIASFYTLHHAHALF